jgi:hypothetical protein
MAIRARIQCINKSDRDNPWERITHAGGTNPDGQRWHRTQEQIIAWIENREYEFYVMVGNHEVDVVVAKSTWGNKYIKTVPDRDTPDNLLSLPECP